MNNVKVYGGFAGGETDTTNRDFLVNESVLSGDFSNNDVLTGTGNTLSITNNTENTYHVVISAGAVGNAELDGFRVRSGNANSNSENTINGLNIGRHSGGGMANYSSSPTLTNCTFTGNSTKFYYGGGMANYSSSPIITNTAFTLNSAESNGLGGGMYNFANSSPTIINCTFTGNLGDFRGGGMYNSNSSPTIANSGFLGNSSDESGGGMYNSNSSPTIINCIFTGNSASYGGGIINLFSSSPNIINSTIAGNKGPTTGGGIYNTGVMGTAILKNCIVFGNSTNISGFLATVSNSIIGGGYTGTNVIDADPLFVFPQPATSAPTIVGDYRLQACSPAINIGNNADVSGVLDLDNKLRIVYDDVDLGAYEQQSNIYADGKYTTWKGLDNDWHNKINWCGGIVPTFEIDATIPATSNNPVLSAAGETKNIVLNNATSITTTASGELTINGTYSNNGSTITNNGTWIMAGNEINQTFPGTSATVSVMNNLEIQNPSGITFDKSFSITGSLIPTEGIIDVNDVEITLKSSDTATASVDIIQPAAFINYTGTGAFIVERFINTGMAAGQHTKTWQFLATPTTGQTITESWRENVTAPTGYGTWITGTGTGFDATTALPSIKYYNQAAINWTPVNNTGDQLVNKLGYMLFVRGDRTVTTYNGNPNNTNMRSKGQLFSPTNPAPSVSVAANKFQTVGNPYASRISFSNVYGTSTGINDVFYVWDPKLAGSYNVGGYQTISGLAGYVPTVGTPPTGNPATDYYPAGVPVPNIESGQAVFVKGNGTGGNVNFNENVKVTGSRLVNRPANPNSPVARRQFLFTSLFTNTGVIADGNIIAFERGFSNEVTEKDAEKIMNGGENFGLKRGNTILAVEAHEPVIMGDTIFYYMSNLRKQPYQLRFAPVNMGTVNHQPFLIDRFNNAITPLSLTDSSFVNFVVTADANAAAAGRFIIVFKLKRKIQFASVDIKAKRQNKQIAVEWEVKNGTYIREYELERSWDRKIFYAVSKIPIKEENKAIASKYVHLDENPGTGYNYYRVKYKGHKEESLYSEVAKVMSTETKMGVSVYPNPIVDEKIQIWFTGIPAGVYSARLYNAASQLMLQKQIRHTGGNNVEIIQPGFKMAHGRYLLEINGKGIEKISQAIYF